MFWGDFVPPGPLTDSARCSLRSGPEWWRVPTCPVQDPAPRLRPIVMTTLAMIFGMLPLAFAIGAGAEMRAPMARAVIGGLITSTLLTLVVVPVVYTYLDGLRPEAVREWLVARRRRKTAKTEAPAPAEQQPAA